MSIVCANCLAHGPFAVSETKDGEWNRRARLSAERGEVERLREALEGYHKINNERRIKGEAYDYSQYARAEEVLLSTATAAPEPKPCQCGSPILRWVHQQPPRECGKVYDAPAPSPVSEAEKAAAELEDELFGNHGNIHQHKVIVDFICRLLSDRK